MNKKYITQKLAYIEDPLEKISLDSQQIAGVLVEAFKGSIISSVPGINKLFEWVERFDQGSREEKLKMLLTKYTERCNSFEDAISRLRLLTSTPGGQTIFRKVLQIVDKGAEDQEWIRLLAVTLERISDEDFNKYFDAQMFILSQIDRLSPQALIVLSKYDTWKEVRINSTSTSSHQTMGDWIPQVTQFMRTKLGIESLEVGVRINHSFRELESTGLVILKGHDLKLTAVGLEIYRVIN